MTSTKVGVTFAALVFTLFKLADVVQGQCETPKLTESYIDRIFKKYGVAEGNDTVLKVAGLDSLMKNLSLGLVEVVCETNDYECLRDKYQRHRPRDPLLSRKRRSAGGGSINPAVRKAHDIEWKKHLDQCIGTSNITSLFGISDSGMTKSGFLNICPTLVQQIDQKVCTHFHKRFPEFIDPDGPPTAAESWGYGFLAIGICSFLSLAVIAMIPCLKKSFYNVIMAYLVALAVGTLAGDAMLHLIPHAFIEGANMAASVTVSKDQRLQQHYSQVWRAMFVLAGIYLFFCVEQFMKLKGSCGKGESHSHEVPMEDPLEPKLVEDGTAEDGHGHGHGDGGAQHGHSHGANKDITGQTAISSVAWMVVVGDGFHNFSDGLAVGAAFSASVSSGVSTTIAIFCHELPHELGDFAILLKSGMTVRQAIVYNLVSTILAFVGLALGILAGTGELGRHIILCLTAGLFLYISLVDMMKEITDTEVVTSRCVTTICQHLGLLSGIGIMLFISLYEHNM